MSIDRLSTLGLVTALLLSPFEAAGHGGEHHAPHGAEPRGGAGHKLPVRRSAVWGTGDLFEVLVKHDSPARGEPLAIEVFVADLETNAPVADAEVSLTLVRDRELLARAAPSGFEGRYVVSVQLPAAGDYEAVASIGREGHIDLVTLGTLRVQPPPITRGMPWGWIVAAGLLMLFSLSAIVLALRRGKPEIADA